MKKYLFVIVLSIVFLVPPSAKSITMDKELKSALILMMNKDPSSFNILEKICKETDNEEACLGVGYCYMYGIGTYFKVDKAEDIFKYYMKSKNQSISRDAKVCLALLYEDGKIDSNNFNTAISIWKDILGCNNEKYVNMAKSHLYTLNIFAMANTIIQDMILFNCDKISFEDLRTRLNNKEYNDFPKNIFNIYAEWRRSFLDSYRSTGYKIKSTLKDISNAIIKGLLRDPSVITDTLNEQNKVDNNEKLVQYADQLWIDFIGMIQKEGVQETWLQWTSVNAIEYCKTK